MSQPLRMLSLCSGIGGIDLAWEWTGGEIAGQVEIDDYCRAVLAKYWPDVPRMGDIREVVGDEFGAVDLVAGGIPCQPFSVAGRRRGAADDRYLWPEMLRVVQVSQPAWLLLENVAGFVGMALDAVSADLEAAGYETGAVLLPACAVGAPHLRERVFLLAFSEEREHQRRERLRLAGAAPEAEPRHDGAAARRGGACVADAFGEREYEPSRLLEEIGRRAADSGSETLADADGNRRGNRARQSQCIRGCGGASDAGADAPQPRWQTQSRLGGGADGLPAWLDGSRWPAGPQEAQAEWEPPRIVAGKVVNRVARLRALGNAVVPAQVYPVLAAIVAWEHAHGEGGA